MSNQLGFDFGHNFANPLATRLASVPLEVSDLIQQGAVFALNHSGGKDSQAMYLYLRKHVPARQLIIIHADLGAVEWAGAVDHIRATTNGEPLHICHSRRTLLEIIGERGMFPSPKQRWCTSDLKRTPIERTIRQTGATIVVNCMGMRAEESPNRAKLIPFQRVVKKCVQRRESKKGNLLHAGREWFEWLPIHDLTETQVFATIAANGQSPHPVYARGMRRFSCVFCIYASDHDLATAARLVTEHPDLVNDPAIYRKYANLERTTGQVMMMPTSRHGRRTLEQITGISADPN